MSRQNVPQTHKGKTMITMIGVNFHFTEQIAEEVIEKMKN